MRSGLHGVVIALPEDEFARAGLAQVAGLDGRRLPG
jgi:hypothetical protein